MTEPLALSHPAPPVVSTDDLAEFDAEQTAEVTLADVASFLRGRVNCDRSITLTPAEVTRLAGLLGHSI